MNCLYKHNKISVTNEEFNGLSSEIDGNGIPRSELKVLPKILLGVICAHMVDFRRPGHIWTLYNWLNKLYSFYMAAVVDNVRRLGLSIHVRRINQPNKSKLELYKPLIHMYSSVRGR